MAEPGVTVQETYEDDDSYGAQHIYTKWRATYEYVPIDKPGLRGTVAFEFDGPETQVHAVSREVTKLWTKFKWGGGR